MQKAEYLVEIKAMTAVEMFIMCLTKWIHIISGNATLYFRSPYLAFLSRIKTFNELFITIRLTIRIVYCVSVY